jgi:hypothetical protein
VGIACRQGQCKCFPKRGRQAQSEFGSRLVRGTLLTRSLGVCGDSVGLSLTGLAFDNHCGVGEICHGI